MSKKYLKNHIEIMKYYDYSKNTYLNLEKLTVGSNKKAWWICEKGHSYSQLIKSKVKGIGCPVCSNRLIIKGVNDLATTNPELLDEWNFEKNSLNNITPYNISKGAEKEVWWICKKCNQTYKSLAYSKKKDVGCPYCNSKKFKTGLNDIFTLNQNWKEYWDFTKNEALGIDSYKIGRNSHVKAWWMCSNCGKSFNRSISKTKEIVLCNECSVDSGVLKRIETYTLKNGSLLDNFPDIAREWDYSKNEELNPSNITSHSSQKVWWICPNGHSYKSDVSHRVSGRGCPKCSKEKSISFPEKAVVYYLNKVDKEIIENYQPEFLNGKEIDIYIKSKNIGIEYDGANWHKDKKRDLQKNKLCSRNGLILYRIRERKCPALNSSSIDMYVETNDNYESLNQVIINLIKDIYMKTIDVNIENDKIDILKLVSFTIKEKSLETLFPDIAKEWDCEKNTNLLPSQFYATSSRKVWWKCPKGHSYECTISHRTVDKNNCPYCSNQKILIGYNDLATTNPEILKEWNYKKNNQLKLFPTNVFKGSHKKAWWICEKKHEWEASISNRVRGRGCPVCSNKLIIKGVNDLTTTHKNVLSMWDYDNNMHDNYYPENYSYGSSEKVWWKCPKCSNVWQQRINHICKGIGCPNCHYNPYKK